MIVEALALRDGVRFAKNVGFPNVVMEMDCLEIVDLWDTRHNSRSVVAPLLLEIGDLRHLQRGPSNSPQPFRASCPDAFIIQHGPVFGHPRNEPKATRCLSLLSVHARPLHSNS